MTEEIIDIGGRNGHIVKQTDTPMDSHRQAQSRFCSPTMIIKPLGEFERLLLKDECRMIRELSDVPFAMVAFEVTEEELQHKVVEGLFSYLKGTLLPWVKDYFTSHDAMPHEIGREVSIILGGYSLGGLFALWSATKLDGIDAVFAGSPSLWMEGWDEYAATHPTKAKYVYMSLGDKEECTKKQPFCRVGDRVRQQHQLHLKQLRSDNCCLEWNEGGHFKDIEMRKAKGFAWCLNKFSTIKIKYS